MLTGGNVVLVGGAGTGKTIGSLIALISLLRQTKSQVGIHKHTHARLYNTHLLYRKERTFVYV